MQLEAIYDEWKKDSEIDKTELGDESIAIPKLHHKYFQMYFLIYFQILNYPF